MNPKSLEQIGVIIVPRWVWGIIISITLILIGGTVTAAQWVATSIINHESRISVNESNMDRLTRIESKLDRLIENKD